MSFGSGFHGEYIAANYCHDIWHNYNLNGQY